MEEEEKKPVFDEEGLQTNAKIKVIGVGGGGSNAVNQMIHDKEGVVEYWVMNTDSQALANSPCENKLVLGRNVTKGLGAGGNPEMGKKAAMDSYNDIQLVVKGSDMVFVAAGEGGGTGTGAAPVVAKAAKEAGCLVLGIVTRPFTFEGKARSLHALEGINELMKNVDALIVVSNDKLMFNNGGMSIKDAFGASDKILASSVKTVTDLILVHGVINLDFADVKATLSGKGLSLIGIGYGEGQDKAIKAATNAINSPLLEASIKGSRSMIINVTVGDDTTLDDVQYAIGYITEAATGDDKADVNIIFGVQMDDSYHNKMKIAIIATDFSKTIDLSATSVPLPRSAADKKAMTPEGKPESAVEKEMAEKKTDSVLPDYLRQFLDDPDNAPKAQDIPVQEKKEPAPETKTDDTVSVLVKPVEEETEKKAPAADEEADEVISVPVEDK
jgi:cell division protein FtsZ